MSNIHSYDKHFMPKVVTPIASQASANSAWEQPFAEAGMANRFLAEINFGVIGTSLIAKITQATSSGGAGAKDITGATTPSILTVSQNGLATIDIGPGALDDFNGYTWVRVEVVVVGTTVWGINTVRYSLRDAGQTKMVQSSTYVSQIRVYDV